MSLELYHRKTCSFSRRVRTFIEDNGLKPRIVYHDIDEDPAARRKLRELTGEEQTPCLVVEGEPVLESDDIVAWLKAHLVDAPRRPRSEPSDEQPRF